jgi:hypothetical protein
VIPKLLLIGLQMIIIFQQLKTQHIYKVFNKDELYVVGDNEEGSKNFEILLILIAVFEE